MKTLSPQSHQLGVFIVYHSPMNAHAHAVHTLIAAKTINCIWTIEGGRGITRMVSSARIEGDRVVIEAAGLVLHIPFANVTGFEMADNYGCNVTVTGNTEYSLFF